MLQDAYFLAKIGADTAENEQHLPKFCHFEHRRVLRGEAAPPGLGGRRGGRAPARPRRRGGPAGLSAAAERAAGGSVTGLYR